MKKTKRLVAITVVVSMLALCSACGSKAPALDEASATRAFTTGVFIPDEGVALASSPGDPALLAAANEALELVNARRAEAGLSALTWSNGLAAAASVRAKECKTLFSHTRPDGSDWWTVDGNIMFGENLAEFFNTPASVVEAWMNSPTHRANILTADYVTCGIAIYEENGEWYWAQEFGY